MKKSLLTLCAGILAMSASAQNFAKGDALVYNFDENFKWFNDEEDIYNQNANWPAEALRAQASMKDGWTCAMFWFAQWSNANVPAESKKDNAGPLNSMTTMADAQAICPVVENPWEEGSSVVKMQAGNWWAYGNFNFALPEVNEVCRIRVVYRVDPTGVDNPYDGTQKPFHIRLTKVAQDECFAEPNFEEQPVTYWNEQGWRVVDLYYNLPDNQTYLALTFDGAGLSCGRNVPFYLKEVSVVPTRLLDGDTHESGALVSEIVKEAPEAVTVGGEGAINEISAASKVAGGIYDLQGRKVAKAGKGLYIINGVKTLVK